MALIRTSSVMSAFSSLTLVAEQNMNVTPSDIAIDAGVYIWTAYYNGSTSVGGNYAPVITGDANYSEFTKHDASDNYHFSCGIIFANSSCTVKKSGAPYGCKISKLT